MLCDLEVRTRAVRYLFDSLKQHGESFTQDFWEVISKGVMFPIFDDLRLSRQEHSKFANQEELSVWLSTTLIQALRLFVELISFYFDKLRFLVDEILNILVICMLQENETLSRIGSTCLQQLIELNIEKLDEKEWKKIIESLIHLLQKTTPEALFFDLNTLEADSADAENPSGSEPKKVSVRRKGPRPQPKEFQKIIVKCILHLLIIQTVQEVLMMNKGAVFLFAPSDSLLLLVDEIYKSYEFADDFNTDLELRTALLNIGFMKQLPNLLKQETSSIYVFVWALGKMFMNREKFADRHSEIELRLIP
jgi:brefeldin A-inhibited guanine nucleotide-exchange protein